MQKVADELTAIREKNDCPGWEKLNCSLEENIYNPIYTKIPSS